MEIVKHIKQHTKNLENGLVAISPEQRLQLKLVALGFYFLLPDFEAIISKYVKIDIDKKQLVNDIQDENIENLQKASEKSNSEMDEYSDDYEALEQIEIFVLDAFENTICDQENTASLVRLFIGIIDTLDYYENFSDDSAYWNGLLEQEVTFQEALLSQVKNQETIDISIYEKRFEKVVFSGL